MKRFIRNIIPYKIYYFIYITFYKIIFKSLKVFKIRKNKIVFNNFNGKGYGDNPKYIAEELYSRNIDLDLDLVWLVKDENKGEFPQYIRTVKYNSFRSFYELATAKLWIDNFRKTININKRKNQYYIQTWHGSIALKKIENDAKDVLPDSYIKNAIYDSKITDIYLSNSTFCSNMYKRAFWYNGQILEYGSPRNDILFESNKKIKDYICQYYKIEHSDKLVLYAPTFRSYNQDNIYLNDFSELLLSLNKFFDCKCKILLRLHPKMSNDNIFNINDNAINVSLYPDIQELLSCCDMLITDYSSCMFDYALTKKPVLLYATDINQYINDRGFYFEYQSLPFPIAENIEALKNNILNFNYENYQNKINDFFNKLNIIEDGNSSKKVVDYIIENIL